MYEIFVVDPAEKYLTTSPKKLRAHLLLKIQVLKVSPSSAGEALKGTLKGYYSLHTTFKGVHYRILYEIYEDVHEVNVLIIGTRERFYDRAKRLLTGK